MMAAQQHSEKRTIQLLPATGVGLGAIVGGGILVLAGTAFKTAGPAAIIAFALNGVIAFLTALSVAEMSTAFPESGGAYTFAKKVLSVRVAFAVGWVLWFAYIVAGVLYALGFGEYAALVLIELWQAVIGRPPAWATSKSVVDTLALLATLGYTLSLIRKSTGGGQWATIGKMIVFAFMIISGFWVLAQQPTSYLPHLVPFFSSGAMGIVQAMGFTFIAMQGFEIIAAVAGEVQHPRRTLPRAMLLSLGTALVVYLPLLFIICTVGVLPGQSITAMSNTNQATVMATAVLNYLGPLGYWLVVCAAILSTLSALQANILAASRVAFSMARDRTLPDVLSQTHTQRGTPVMAIYASALALVVILFMVPDLASAGAAASLIFLISFALAHWTSFLARRRAVDGADGFRAPYYPAVQTIGGLSCAALALFQAVAVPTAGGITTVWLGLGVILYMALFARRAAMKDAFAEAADPRLVRFRGRNPLVLVPVANPSSAPALISVASALAPLDVGRVLLLSVVKLPPSTDDKEAVAHSVELAQQVLQEALTASLGRGHIPEALVTVAAAPWSEISRVARIHHCESLLLGLHKLEDPETNGAPLEQVLNEVDCDVTILRSQQGWELTEARRVLIPMGGKGVQDELRSRFLGSLCRTGQRELTFLQILPAAASEAELEDARQDLARLAALESPTRPVLAVVKGDDVMAVIKEHAAQSDLILLGLPRVKGRKLFGELALRVAQEVSCATIMISRGR